MLVEILRLILEENKAFSKIVLEVRVSSTTPAALILGVGVGELCRPSRKRCPDFGDAATEVHCCPSRVKPGTFFCCDAARKAEEFGIVAGMPRETRLILGCVCGGVALLASLVLLWCLCSDACPLHRWRRRKRQGLTAYGRDSRPGTRESGLSHSRSNPHYHPVATSEGRALPTEPPKPSPYAEAPPPYRLASEYPSLPPGDIHLPSSPAYSPLATSTPPPRVPPAGKPYRRSAELNRLRRGRELPVAPEPASLPYLDENEVNAAVEASLPKSTSSTMP